MTRADLTEGDVLAIARLARLHLEPDEVERLRGELSAILVHMDALAEVDTSGVEPMTHAVPMRLRLRDDEPTEALPVEQAVGPAPDRADDLFQVPHILKTAASAGGPSPASGAGSASGSPAGSASGPASGSNR